MVSILPLTAKAAEVAKRRKRIIGPVDLSINGTGVTIVMGPNGAGKTTLLRALHGIERLSSGTITWAQPLEFARTRQSFVFQTPIVLRRSVADNLAYPLRIHGLTARAAQSKAVHWANKIGLADALTREARVLSGGERQKLALARALITGPEVLFLDEPTANLDGRAMREIETILQTAVSAGTRVVMATHNLGQARRLATEIIFLYKGQIHESTPAAAFFTTPQTPEAAAFVRGDIVE